MTDAVASPTISAPEPLPRAARWIFALTLMSALTILQLVFATAIFSVYAGLNGLTFDDLAAMGEDLLFSETGSLLQLLAFTGAVLVVIGTAYTWGQFWAKLTDRPRVSTKEWLAWYQLQGIKLWAVPPLTLLLVAASSQGVNQLIGPTGVDAQTLLVQTRLLQLIAIPVAGILAPVGEELVFRGALYNALLLKEREGLPTWVRHLPAYIMTTLTFVLIHAGAGFQETGSYILLLILSAFLGLLRATTGSVKAAVVGHMTSNLAGLVGLIAAESLATSLM